MDFNDKRILIGGAAAIAILAAGTGALLARGSDGGERTAAAEAAAPGSQEQAEGEGEHAEGEEGHADEEGVVALTPERIRLAGIEVVTVRPGAVGAEIIAQAVVQPTAQGQAGVAARADGAVTRINVRLGDAVRAGQTLALLESREASAIAAERSSAQARAVLARASYAREQRLFNARVTARQDLEAAQAALSEAEAEVRRTAAAGQAARVTGDGRSIALISPISGRVTASPAVLGSFVAAGTELFRVTDPARVQVEASVPVADADRIGAGDAAELETATGRSSAVVRAVTASADAETRALTVVLQPTSGTVRPGQSLRVRIMPRATGAAGSAIVLPADAVQTIESRTVVFVRTDEGFRATPVTLGPRNGDRVEVRSGLDAGAVVAARNAFLLTAELGKSEAGHEH